MSTMQGNMSRTLQKPLYVIFSQFFFSSKPIKKFAYCWYKKYLAHDESDCSIPRKKRENGDMKEAKAALSLPSQCEVIVRPHEAVQAASFPTFTFCHLSFFNLHKNNKKIHSIL